MKCVYGGLFLCVLLVGIGYAQNDPLNGTWKVNLAKSSGQLPKEERVILEISNNKEHGINDITGPDGVRTRGEYTATYDDGKWYPGKSLDTGKPTGTNMLIRLSPRSELRIGKLPDGKVGFMVLRAASEDGKTMTITTLDPYGKVTQNLFLEKQ